MADRLKLRALDDDDLAVVAACLQDALLPIGDMSFQPQEKRFVFVANRFCWESGAEPATAEEGTLDPTGDATYEDDGQPVYQRTNCGVWFDGVRAVRTRGIDLRDRGRILELLTLRREGEAVLMVFAGGATLRLEVTELRCFLEDIGEGWPTRWRPGHDLDSPEPDRS